MPLAAAFLAGPQRPEGLSHDYYWTVGGIMCATLLYWALVVPTWRAWRTRKKPRCKHSRRGSQ